MAFAKLSIIGNLGRDPEMRYTPAGKSVTEFSVAVSHRRRDDATGEWSDGQTDWYRVTSWGAAGERLAEQLHKGSKVFVEGRFTVRDYVTKDGEKRTSMEISSDTVVNLTPRADAEDGTFQPSGAGSRAPSASADLDDLPF